MLTLLLNSVLVTQLFFCLSWWLRHTIKIFFSIIILKCICYFLFQGNHFRNSWKCVLKSGFSAFFQFKKTIYFCLWSLCCEIAVNISCKYASFYCPGCLVLVFVGRWRVSFWWQKAALHHHVCQVTASGWSPDSLDSRRETPWVPSLPHSSFRRGRTMGLTHSSPLRFSF